MLCVYELKLVHVCSLCGRSPDRIRQPTSVYKMWHVGNMTGHHAMYMLIQCTPLLVEKAGVAPDVTFRITACKQERVQARYPLWIWNPWGRTHEVQNRSNQWLHKMDLGPDKKIKKKKKKARKYIGFELFEVMNISVTDLHLGCKNIFSFRKIWIILNQKFWFLKFCGLLIPVPEFSNLSEVVTVKLVTIY